MKNQHKIDNHSAIEKVCPQCGSQNIQMDEKGFDIGEAIAGNILLGPIGILLGAMESDDTVYKCKACGYEWSE